MGRLDHDSPIPLYHQIERALLDLIKRDGLERGSRLPSETELAVRFGVTRATVRNAIERLERQGIISRARGRGTFVADPALVTAALLAGQDGREPSGQSSIIMFVAPGTSVASFRTLTGAQQEAHARGFQLAVAHSDDDPALEARLVDSAITTRAAGLLLWPLGGATDRRALARLRGVGIPYVFLDRYLEDIDADHVVVDDLNGAYRATAHLAALGHRRIALMRFANLDVSAVRLRFEGYRQALADHDIPFLEDLVYRVPYHDIRSFDEITSLARRLLDASDPPTAAFCVNDHISQTLLVALERLGTRVPEAFSIAGFDGLDYLPTHQHLTTVRRATDELGREATRLLVSRIHGTKDPTPRHVVLPTELIVGQTTGPPRRSSALKTVAAS